MAYTVVTGHVELVKPAEGAIRRFLNSFFAARSDRAMAGGLPRRLAGPIPGDVRAKGYLADLDIEVGF